MNCICGSCNKTHKKNKKFIQKIELDVRAQGISEVVFVKLKFYYFDLLRHLNKLKCNIKKVHYTVTILFVMIFALLTIIQSIFNNLESFGYVIVRSILSLLPLGLTVLYGLYRHKYQYSDKRFVYSQLIDNLKFEGKKYAEWYKVKKYTARVDNIDDGFELFHAKIKKIIQNSAIKFETNGHGKYKISIASRFLPDDMLESIV